MEPRDSGKDPTPETHTLLVRSLVLGLAGENNVLMTVISTLKAKLGSSGGQQLNVQSLTHLRTPTPSQAANQSVEGGGAPALPGPNDSATTSAGPRGTGASGGGGLQRQAMALIGKFIPAAGASVGVGRALVVALGGALPLAGMVASSVFVIGKGGVNIYFTNRAYSKSVGNSTQPL